MENLKLTKGWYEIKFDLKVLEKFIEDAGLEQVTERMKQIFSERQTDLFLQMLKEYEEKTI